MENILPFSESIENGWYIRTFLFETDPNLLKWHWDDEDRVVEAIGETNWMFQFDNEIPQSINGKQIYIEKGKWHRIIKGDGDLTLRIKKN